jgi:hypothetical protein
MPAKKNPQTGVEDEAPVEAKSNQVEDHHVKLRDERRALEAELATIDAELRQAINDGNLEALDKLSARKAELPRQYIAASTGEMAARHAMFTAEDQGYLNHLRTTEDKRDRLQAALAKMKVKHAEELAALNAELQEAIAEVGATYASIQASRNLSAACDFGFKRAMAAITGV